MSRYLANTRQYDFECGNETGLMYSTFAGLIFWLPKLTTNLALKVFPLLEVSLLLLPYKLVVAQFSIPLSPLSHVENGSEKNNFLTKINTFASLILALPETQSSTSLAHLTLHRKSSLLSLYVTHGSAWQPHGLPQAPGWLGDVRSLILTDLWLSGHEVRTETSGISRY
jgi:hypothetical protein